MNQKMIEQLGVFSTGFVGAYVVMSLSTTITEICTRLGLLALLFFLYRKYFETSVEEFLAAKLMPKRGE